MVISSMCLSSIFHDTFFFSFSFHSFVCYIRLLVIFNECVHGFAGLYVKICRLAVTLLNCPE